MKNYFNTLSLNLTDTIKEGFNIIKTYPNRFLNKTAAGKLVSITKLSLMTAAIPLSMALTQQGFLSTISILGAGSLAIGFLSTRFEKNSHINTSGAIGTYILASQLALLDSIGFTIFAAAGATRMLVMASIPDNENSVSKRNKLALGFGLVSGSMIIGASILKAQPMELIPLISIALGSIASAKINEKSYIARRLYLGANLNNTTYAYYYANSMAAVIGGLVNILNLATTIYEKDVKRPSEQISPK